MAIAVGKATTIDVSVSTSTSASEETGRTKETTSFLLSSHSFVSAVSGCGRGITRSRRKGIGTRYWGSFLPALLLSPWRRRTRENSTSSSSPSRKRAELSPGSPTAAAAATAPRNGLPTLRRSWQTATSQSPASFTPSPRTRRRRAPPALAARVAMLMPGRV